MSIIYSFSTFCYIALSGFKTEEVGKFASIPHNGHYLERTTVKASPSSCLFATSHFQTLLHITPVPHIKNSTSGMSVYEGMCRWQVSPEISLSWGLYEGESSNSLCMCKFSIRTGGLPISRPCLIHYLSFLPCFFFSVNSLYFSRTASQSTARRVGSRAGGHSTLCLLNSQVPGLPQFPQG